MTFITGSWIVDILVLIAPLFATFYFLMTYHYNYWKQKGVPYTEPSFPFGNLKSIVFFKKSIGDFIKDVYNSTDGPYKGYYAFNRPYLVFKDPNMIKTILVSKFEHFSDRGIASNHDNDLVGTYNLLLTDNPEWKSMRAKLSPLFSSAKIKSMFSLVKEVGDDLVRYIDTAQQCQFDAKNLSAKYTIDGIATCAFGLKANSLVKEGQLFEKAARKITHFCLSRAIHFTGYFFAPEYIVKLFRLKFIHPESTKFCRKVFTDTIEHRDAHKFKRGDLIDTLIDLRNSDKNMKNDRLLAHAILYLVAGYDAPSSTMAFAIHELAVHPDMQEKLRKDIKTVLANHGGEWSCDALTEMKYLDMVIAETLRKYPPLAFLSRQVTKPYTFPGTGLTVDKGTYINISVSGLHHDPKYFPNPEKFDPERFSEENRKKIPFGIYIPFGCGPHNCIGERFGLMNTKLGLGRVVVDFHIEKPEGAPEKLTLDPKGFSSSPLYGVPVNIRRVKA